MVKSHRLFNCADCLRQVRICTMCDYGNVFCPQCSGEVVRLRKVREAGDRYQRTEKGRLNHKVRQQFYLQRQNEKMTHQGSPKEYKYSPFRILGSPTLIPEGPKYYIGMDAHCVPSVSVRKQRRPAAGASQPQKSAAT